MILNVFCKNMYIYRGLNGQSEQKNVKNIFSFVGPSLGDAILFDARTDS